MNVFLFLVAIFIFSQLGNIIRFSEASATVTTFWRLLFTIILLVPVLIHGRSYKAFSKITKKQWPRILLAGISLFIAFDLFIHAIQMTTVAQATILFSIHPIITATGGLVFLKERLRLNHILAIGLGLTGVLVLFEGNIDLASEQLIGSVYAILSAVSFSIYLVTSKVARKSISNTVFVSLVYSIAAVISFSVVLFKGNTLMENSSQSWWAFLALAIFPTLLGHALFTYLLKKENLNYISCGILIHSPLAAITADFLFDEAISLEVIASIGLSSLGLLCVILPLHKWTGNKSTTSVAIELKAATNLNNHLNEEQNLIKLNSSREGEAFEKAS